MDGTGARPAIGINPSRIPKLRWAATIAGGSLAACRHPARPESYFLDLPPYLESISRNGLASVGAAMLPSSSVRKGTMRP